MMTVRKKGQGVVQREGCGNQQIQSVAAHPDKWGSLAGIATDAPPPMASCCFKFCLWRFAPVKSDRNFPLAFSFISYLSLIDHGPGTRKQHSVPASASSQAVHSSIQFIPVTLLHVLRNWPAPLKSLLREPCGPIMEDDI